jgi:uncharacterized protein YfaP (DUF2135 family)
VVLTWNDLDGDLDLHLSGPDGSGGRFHAAWFAQNPVSHASLDLDDTDGEGPETVTVTISTSEGDYVEGEYRVWVHDYPFGNDGPDFSGAAAVVTFFDRTAQAAQFSAADATGSPAQPIWRVFDFTVNHLDHSAAELHVRRSDDHVLIQRSILRNF